MSTVTQADREAAANFCAVDDDGFDTRLFVTKLRAGLDDENPVVQAFAAHRTSSQVELLEALEEARTCLLDGDDIFPDRACRDDTILEILNTAISNARSNSMVSGRVS